jgi:hypothetical protein
VFIRVRREFIESERERVSIPATIERDPDSTHLLEVTEHVYDASAQSFLFTSDVLLSVKNVH